MSTIADEHESERSVGLAATAAGPRVAGTEGIG